MILEIEIVNWEKYNPRKDVKRPSWFAVDNRFYEHAHFSDKPDPQMMLCWLYLLAQQSQKAVGNAPETHRKRTGNVTVSTLKATRNTGIRQKRFVSYVVAFHLQGKLVLQDAENIGLWLKTRNAHVTLQDKTEQDTTLQDNIYCGDRSPPVADRDPPTDVIYNSTDSNLVNLKPTKNRKSDAMRASEISCMQTLDLARSWYEFVSENQKWRVNLDLNKFIIGVDKIVRLAGINIEQLTELFKWASNDDFWSDKIHSPLALMKKSKNEQRKIDNLLNSFGRVYKRQRLAAQAVEDALSGNVDCPFSFAQA